MATFDPTKARKEGSGGDFGLPPGNYLLAIMDFTLKQNKKQTGYYMECKVASIVGPTKGKHWRERISLDVSNSGTAFRLSLLAEGVGQKEAFDLEDESELRRVFLRKPFKATVRRFTENGYTTNGIERYLVGDKITAEDRDVMDQWLIDREAGSNFEAGNDGGSADRLDDVPLAVDEDIPF